MPALPDDPGSLSHMMKMTKRGRPFLKDTLDLYATLIVSLQLAPHAKFFKTYQNSFTMDEAAQNLASLKFSQSNRGPDPREPSCIVTTTTTTTFSMTREMAKVMSQHFMDGRLIENATDPSSNLFKDRGLYVLTPKGLHVLEQFISKNGINSDHLQNVFVSQPICIKLLHLERRTSNDEIIVTQSVIAALFRHFVGRKPNYLPQMNAPQDTFAGYNEQSKGVSLMDVTDHSQPLQGKGQQHHKYCFGAVTLLEWLCDFTSVVGREEAAEMAAHFVRLGLIALVSDKRKNNDSAVIFTVRGSAPGGNSPISQHGEFRCTAAAIYKITDEGQCVAHWVGARNNIHDSPNTSSVKLTATRSSIDEPEKKPTDEIHRRIVIAEKLNYEEHKGSKESNTDHLKYILEDPALCSLFCEFLKGNFCEENLSFWLEVEDFKSKFSINSSVIAVPSPNSGGKPGQDKVMPGQVAMEMHHKLLINTVFFIYNKYLAPSSQCELNIDHELQNELSKYLLHVMTRDPEHMTTFNVMQLQMMIRVYARIQMHIFRLMATDYVPKFIKTPKFLAIRNWVEDFDPSKDNTRMLHTLSPGPQSEETGGTYITISQQASKREQ
ncbi:regulator of G protein signaling domain-containing protein [Mycena metata]|uniref:Regulator of G protein signaling domain-containing protein n=1 Tax=Mycena metata TaxID=1033252 RepID=A0AAD7JAD0_9AGAR|nr:regulator of G protein signaling domain-containing protein [Mycena metata]